MGTREEQWVVIAAFWMGLVSLMIGLAFLVYANSDHTSTDVDQRLERLTQQVNELQNYVTDLRLGTK